MDTEAIGTGVAVAVALCTGIFTYSSLMIKAELGKINTSIAQMRGELSLQITQTEGKLDGHIEGCIIRNGEVERRFGILESRTVRRG